MSISVDHLDRSALERVSRLCRRAIVDPPSSAELDGALFVPDQPVVVLGDPDVGVVAVAECDDGPHIRLLAVDPSARGQGNGRSLLQSAEERVAIAGHHRLVTGADPPYHLWPGVPTTETALLCLFESHHYVRTETNFDMRVDLRSIPPDPGRSRTGPGHGPGRDRRLDDQPLAQLAPGGVEGGRQGEPGLGPGSGGPPVRSWRSVRSR